MNFCISIPYGLEQWQLFFDIFYRDYFEGLELPADYLSFQNLNQLLKKTNQSILNVVDIIDPPLLRNVAFQEDKVKNKVFEHISSIITNESYNADNFLVDLGFSQTNKDLKDDSKRILFLKKFCYYLYVHKKFVCLPVNISSEFGSNINYSYYLKILTNIMFNYFKLTINLYPHELKSDFPVFELYKNLIFFTKNVRLIYEPDTGNYLTEKLLLFWLEPLKKFGFKGEVIIVPKTLNNHVYETEVKKNTTIIEKLKTKLL